MPHQCVRCSKMYEDGAPELLKGCNSCGGRFFFFMKRADIEAARKLTVKLTPEERNQIEQDVVELVGAKMDKEKPVVLDLENVRVLKPGKFEIDLIDLFRGKPLVYKLEDGKYIIDLVSSFRSKKVEI